MYKKQTEKHIFQVIDGKKIFEDLLLGLRRQIVASGQTPELAVILVGNDPASEIYVKRKKEAAEKIGAGFHLYRYEGTDETEVLTIIDYLNKDPRISGILVQLPLPRGFDTNKIIRSIDPKKDADGFHPKNIQDLLEGKRKTLPPLIQTILALLDSQQVELSGSSIAVLAKSDMFRRVIEKVLTDKGARVNAFDLSDLQAPKKIKEADILITLLGKPGVITGDMIKQDCVIIDIGTTKTTEGIKGDIDFESIQKVASAATPTPGGTGPVTVVKLFEVLCNITQ